MSSFNRKFSLVFTASVQLLIAVCKKRNLECQQQVSALIPVDAILSVLHSDNLSKDVLF